jgi:WD40 repeat protein
VFKGHTETICCVSIAPKHGGMFVSAGQDNTIKVWDIKQIRQNDFETVRDLEKPLVINQATLTVMAH